MRSKGSIKLYKKHTIWVTQYISTLQSIKLTIHHNVYYRADLYKYRFIYFGI